MNIRFSREGKAIGEYSDEGVPALLQSGVLRSSDLYWQPGMSDWAAVKSKWYSWQTPLELLLEETRKVRQECEKIKWAVRIAAFALMVILIFGLHLTLK
jgi:hypothetical protein